MIDPSSPWNAWVLLLFTQAIMPNVPVLQIRSGSRDNFRIIFPLKIYCDPLLEPSHRDGSKEWSQYMFSLRNKKKISLKYPQYPLLSRALTCPIFLQLWAPLPVRKTHRKKF